MQKIIQKAKELYVKYENIILYVFFGGLTTVVSFATHFLTRFLGGNLSMAVTISWICAVTFAFFTNKFWVFKSKSVTPLKFLREAGLFYAARLASLLIEQAIMLIFADYLDWNELLTKIGAQVIILIMNYAFSKFIVFKKSHKSGSSK
ncbi:MAG: GtrA family protein [Oscillospiraceae bacterium]